MIAKPDLDQALIIVMEGIPNLIGGRDYSYGMAYNIGCDT